ncbi:hypothetical protein PHYPSEUDO_000355 [Phytophthora pseudosyringae]|uniref:Uncharacterized protein n=1 Tax=Phytophthora pseudosyringae TaxID=221518 RepID=A0A8T1V5K8_9STRA|nr:hypothetical protein PHYPSEUDO_000355 [Phytophthora pseudosyringae]
MVASLTPQISYFTTLDQYVFFCFIIACVVAIENALFPLFVDLFPRRESWQENSLLGFSCGFFTLVNVVWALYITVFVKMRRRASGALVKVHETIKVISASIPPEHREAVLHEYMERFDFYKWEIPTVSCGEFGYLYVQLPEDESPHTELVDARVAFHTASRRMAEREFDAFKEIYQKLNPSGSLLYPSGTDSDKPLQAAKPNEAFLAGGGGRDRRRSVAAPSSPVAPRARMNTQSKYHRMV